MKEYCQPFVNKVISVDMLLKYVLDTLLKYVLVMLFKYVRVMLLKYVSDSSMAIAFMVLAIDGYVRVLRLSGKICRFQLWSCSRMSWSSRCCTSSDE